MVPFKNTAYTCELLTLLSIISNVIDRDWAKLGGAEKKQVGELTLLVIGDKGDACWPTAPPYSQLWCEERHEEEEERKVAIAGESSPLVSPTLLSY
jgi:hypothetical protein